MIKYGGEYHPSDNDLHIDILGFSPRVEIKDGELKRIFEKKFGRTDFGGDEIIAYFQSLVSHKMDFAKLEEEILKDTKIPDKDFSEILFNKTATGIGRGHSLGGLSGVTLGIDGTKMIDSGLTGLCMSRSLVTSGRRRETESRDIVIPKVLEKFPDLLKEYMDISTDTLNLSERFKGNFGKLGGIETFNKILPYNTPANLYITLPLDTLSTLASEVRADKLNPNEKFVPREIYSLVDSLPEITKKIGQNTMFRQRKEVPRDTYFHYTVFKDPSIPNSISENEIFIDPVIKNLKKDFTRGFMENLEKVKTLFEKTKKITNPEKLHESSLDCTSALRSLVEGYNEALRIDIADSLSWRVWSEQKRHSTLRQDVESIFSATSRAYTNVKPFWKKIEEESSKNNFEYFQSILPSLEQSMIIDDRLKKQPELLIPYIYHTAKQLMFYGKLVERGIEQRDALYIVPRNIRLRTSESYDLINLIDLELPLRLCSSCEPERKESSWKKREVIINAVPELDYFLNPKCNLGFCTEGNYCNKITNMRDYNLELHKGTKKVMLDQAR